ncbi:MAG: hypothetical protein MUF21_02175, partial [Gemmatimonadaceae bacterium]|nr:hypothetical protein [Gemmatimonadaceae bacterium]
PRVSTTIVVLARHTARWMLRDAGWRVLAALGALNVAVQAWRAARGGGDATVLALDTLVVHARLFLILLATIYAGELLWREEEQRSAPLLDALPVRRWATTVGGLAGVIAAQLVLVALLASVAAMATVAAGARSPNAGAFAVGVAAWIAAPFVAWMLLSWAVHVVVRHKVAAHFACIAAWVVAITVHDAMRDVALWRAFTLPPIVPLDAVRDALPFHRAVRAAGAWLAAGIVALLLVLPRATRRR